MKSLLYPLLALACGAAATGTACACGSYQTCTDITVLNFNVSPRFRSEGEPVHVSVESFEFANWYGTVSTMTFPPVTIGHVAQRILPANTVQTFNYGPYGYGFFYPYYYYWYVQNTKWLSTFDWDGLDGNGIEVAAPVALNVTVSAGSASTMKSAVIYSVSGKDLGEPECPEGNPCNPASGNKHEAIVEYVGGDLVPSVVAHYNHMADVDAGHGAGWTNTFMKRLQPSTNTLILVRNDGRRERASLTNGTWRSDPDSRLHISADANGYTVSSDDGLIELYALDGRLLRETDRRGRTTLFTYDGSNDLLSVTGPAGHLFGISWSQDRIAGITLPSADQIQYTYDAAGNLASIIWPDGATRRFLYENPDFPNALTGIIDENGGQYAYWEYDAVGRITVSNHANGADLTRFAYGVDASGKTQTTVTLPTTGQRQYTFDKILGQSRFSRIVRNAGSNQDNLQTNRDANGNVTDYADYNGNLTTYTHDLARNLQLQRIEAAGTPVARTISTQWHPDWRLEVKRAEPKKLTTWVYHGQPDPTAGNAPAQCAPAGALLPDGKPIAVLCKKIEQATGDTNGSQGFAAAASGAPRIWAWTYNARGQVLSADGPRTDLSDVTQYLYYSDTTADHTEGDLRTITNPMGHVTEFTRYDKNGRPLELKDPNGQITTLSYSPRGWLMTRTVGNRTTNYDYDAVGQLTKVTQADGSWLGYDYDPAHRLIGIHDQSGNRIDYTLDPAGNRVEEKVSDPGGALARNQSRTYDELSRLKNLIQPN